MPAWDLGNVTYTGKAKSVYVENPSPWDMFFKDDGTKMYLLGQTAGDRVLQYTLSVAWDVSTATYDTVSDLVDAENITMTSFTMRTNGASMYVLGTSGADAVYQYTLGTPWDMGTSTYASKSLNITEDLTPVSVRFKPDGTALYVLGEQNKRIFEYTVSTPWDIATASYSGNSVLVNDVVADPKGMEFKSDGTKLYVVGNDVILQYNVGVAWDLSTITYDSVQWEYGSVLANHFFENIRFSNNGNELYVVSRQYTSVTQLRLSTAWDLSTAVFEHNRFHVGGIVEVPYAAEFSPDGTRMFVGGRRVDSYTLAVPWDVRTASYDNKTIDLSSFAWTTGLAFKPDGLAFYIVEGNSGGNVLHRYNMSTAWDVSTATAASQTKSLATEDFNANGIHFKPDGTQLFMVGSTTDALFRYTMSTPWDISTATVDVGSTDLSTEDTSPRGLVMTPDGLKMFMAGLVTDSVYQYRLTEAWNHETAVYTGKSYYFNAQEQSPRGLAFKADGTVMYIIGNDQDHVTQYYLEPEPAQFKVGALTVPPTTGTQTISNLGFTPKAIIFYSSGVSTGDTVFEVDVHQLLGFAVNGTARSVGVQSEDAQGFSDSDRRDDDVPITLLTQAGVASSSNITIWGMDGVTLNWTAVQSSHVGKQIFYMAISSVEAAVVEWTTPTTAIAKAVTGVGFTPDLVLHVTSALTASPASASGAMFMMGAMNAAGDQWSCGWNDPHGLDVTDNHRWFSSTQCIRFALAGLETEVATFTSMDLDGFTTTFSTAAATAYNVYSLCLKGLDSKVDTMTATPSNVGPALQIISGHSFKPKAVLFTGAMLTWLETSIGSTAFHSFGMTDLVSNIGGGTLSENNVTVTQADSVGSVNRSILQHTFGPAMYAQGAVSSFNSDGFNIAWDVATGNLNLRHPYISFGSNEGPSAVITEPTTGTTQIVHNNLNLRWTYSDPESNPQNAFSVRRIIDGITVEYWNGTDWQAFESPATRIASTNTQASLGTDWGDPSSETLHAYSVKVWDDVPNNVGDWSTAILLTPFSNRGTSRGFALPRPYKQQENVMGTLKSNNDYTLAWINNYVPSYGDLNDDLYVRAGVRLGGQSQFRDAFPPVLGSFSIGNGTNYFQNLGAVNVYRTNELTISSEEYKQFFESGMTNALGLVLSVPVEEYTYLDETRNVDAEYRFGIVLEDLKYTLQVMGIDDRDSAFIIRDDSGEEFLNGEQLMFVMWQAIQELYGLIPGGRVRTYPRGGRTDRIPFVSDKRPKIT